MSDLTRRQFLAAGAAAGLGAAPPEKPKALVAITLDLEMSAGYPKPGMAEWNYRKGDLDGDTKRYSLKAAQVVKARGGRVHFFALGQTLEQEDVGWLKELAAAGHPVGNHTYDHVNLLATRPEDVQFRFRRAPWLIRGQTVPAVIERNVESATLALRERCGIAAAGFRTPGGFADGLKGRENLQRMLLRQGFPWVSSLYPAHAAGRPKEEPTAAVLADIVRAQAAAQPFSYPSGLVEVPMSPVSDVTAFRAHGWKLGWFLRALRSGVEAVARTGGCFDFLAHPSCLVVEDPGCESLKLICDLVTDAGDRAELATLDRLAARAGEP